MPYYFGDLDRDPSLENYPHANRHELGLGSKVQGLGLLSRDELRHAGVAHGHWVGSSSKQCTSSDTFRV